jgi:hypothetical protein
MPFSQYMATQILNWVRGTAMPAAPTGLFVTIHSASPTNDGSAANITSTVTGNSNRIQLPQADLAAITSVGGGGFERLNAQTVIITNSAVNGSSAFASHAAIWDANTGGNLLLHDGLSVVTEIQFGDLVKFDPSTVSVRVI